MLGMAVHINRPPHSARLVAWGRTDESWWGCVVFQQRVRPIDGNGATQELEVAAWVPASALTLPGWSQSVEVPRMTLPVWQKAWPAPPGWPSWYAGVWVDGGLALPAGLEIVTGAAWRRR